MSPQPYPICASFLASSPRKPTFKRVRSTSFPSDTTIHISEILPHLLKIFAWISSVILCVGFSIRLLKFSLLSLLLTSHQILNSSHEKLYPSRRYLFTLSPTHCLVKQLSIFKANSRNMMEKTLKLKLLLDFHLPLPFLKWSSSAYTIEYRVCTGGTGCNGSRPCMWIVQYYQAVQGYPLHLHKFPWLHDFLINWRFGWILKT